MQKSKKIEMLVFDLDGTLIDSKHDIANAVNWTLKKYGAEAFPESYIETFVRTSVRPLIEEALSKIGNLSIDQAFADFKQYYFDHLCDHTVLFPGILDVLEYYAAKPKVILTNKSNMFLPKTMKELGLGSHFKQFFGKDSFPTQKPDAGPLRAISEQFNVDLEKIVMIGDTDVDIMAGKNAKTRTCAVMYGYGDKEVLRNLGPDYSVQKPLDLIGLFES